LEDVRVIANIVVVIKIISVRMTITRAISRPAVAFDDRPAI
jgi:hypothetical protein